MHVWVVSGAGVIAISHHEPGEGLSLPNVNQCLSTLSILRYQPAVLCGGIDA